MKSRTMWAAAGAVLSALFAGSAGMRGEEALPLAVASELAA